MSQYARLEEKVFENAVRLSSRCTAPIRYFRRGEEDGPCLRRPRASRESRRRRKREEVGGSPAGSFGPLSSPKGLSRPIFCGRPVILRDQCSFASTKQRITLVLRGTRCFALPVLRCGASRPCAGLTRSALRPGTPIGVRVWGREAPSALLHQ